MISQIHKTYYDDDSSLNHHIGVIADRLQIANHGEISTIVLLLDFIFVRVIFHAFSHYDWLQSEPGEPGCIACKEEDWGFNLIERTAQIGLYSNNTTTLVIIQIGEEITDCYGFHYTGIPVESRKQKLEKWFNFTVHFHAFPQI